MKSSPAIVIAIVASAFALRGASFQGLGDLPGGTFLSYATAVSADGTVVVGASKSTNGTEAFRWSAATGMVGLGVLPGTNFSSIAYGVSSDGSIIAGSSSSSLGSQAFRWTTTNGMLGLGDLPGGNFSSAAFAISGDGQVIVGVGWSAASSSEAFRWTATEGMAGLGDLPGGDFYSVAQALSEDGAVIVGSSISAASQPFTEAFRWTAQSGMAGLGDLQGGLFTSIAYGISPDGSVIVGRGYPDDYHEEAFRWNASSGFTALGFLPCNTWTVARGCSQNGAVIVGDPQSSTPCVFIWDSSHGLRNLQQALVSDYGLNLGSWQLVSASAISADGNFIVGYGKNPSGQTEAWLANIAPPFLAVRGSGKEVVLSWPTNTPGFTLQWATNLISPMDWMNSTDTPVLVGAQFVVTNTATEASRFYQLKK